MDRSIPAISVIIPCYDLGLYLEQAVDSVSAQTFQDFEVIIVDDGSTDQFTRFVLDKFDRPKTRLIRQSNQGLAAARNHGIRQAAGRYICCLDADDRIRADFFQSAFTVLETQSDIGFVTGYFQMFGDRNDTFRYQTCAFPELLVYNQAVEPAVFRRAAWERTGGYCETFCASGIEDWDFWITIIELGYRAEVIPEIVWDYRMRQNQMSTRMYQPDIWGRLCRELVVRHEPSYRKYLVEVFAVQAARWAEVRDWANARSESIIWWQRQSENWQRLAEERERAIREQLKLNQQQQSWIEELEKAKGWLEAQQLSLRQLAEALEQTNRGQRTSIEELEQAKGWLEGQRSTWERLAGEREQVIRDQQAWMEELEKAKGWLEEQRSIWERLAGEREQVIREQQSWIGALTIAKSRLEEQQSSWWPRLRKLIGKASLALFT